MRTLFLCSVLFVAGGAAALAQAPKGDVSVQIQPRIGNGNFCVDAKRDAESDGTPVFIYQCHGSENQRWTVSSSVNNQRVILGTGGYCLDVRGTNASANGTPTQLWKCHFGDNQRFSLEPDGRIKEVRSGKCLVATAVKDGAPLVLSPCTNAPGEVFMLRK